MGRQTVAPGGWAPGRGRPVELPYDATPLRGGSIDVDARIAWLLRINRLADPTTRSAAAFADKLRQSGTVISETVISRIETARMPAPDNVLTAYEKALGRQIGEFTCMAHALRRTAVGPFDTAIERDRIALRDQLDDLDGRIDSHAMRGGDWLTMADLLTHRDGVILPKRIREEWLMSLLREMMRSTGAAYITRFESLSRLIADPLTRHHLADLVMTTVEEPGAQAVIDACSLLGEAHDERLFDLTLQLLTSEHEGSRRGAVTALAQRVVLGAFSGEEIDRVNQTLVDLALADPEGNRDLVWSVAQRISMQMTQQIASIVDPPLARDTAGSHIQSPAHLGDYLAACAAESGLVNDKMLDRLLREALSPDFTERRHHSLLALRASPYRRVVATVAERIMVAENQTIPRQAAGLVLGYLALDDQQQALTTALASPFSDVRASALQALAHSAGVPEDYSLTPLAADPDVVGVVTYAAGMSGHPDLVALESDPQLSEVIHQRAQWWTRNGTAVVD